MNIWYAAVSAFVGYLLAAMLSANVSLTLSLTVWGSVWTYVVLLFWWFVGYFITWMLIVAVFMGGYLAVLGTLAGLLGLASVFEKRKRR